MYIKRTELTSRAFDGLHINQATQPTIRARLLTRLRSNCLKV